MASASPSVASSLRSRADSAGGVTLSERAAALSDGDCASASTRRKSSIWIIHFSLTIDVPPFNHGLPFASYTWGNHATPAIDRTTREEHDPFPYPAGAT
ncbi:hypothetical protein D3C81_1897180 [compost metagenome]